LASGAVENWNGTKMADLKVNGLVWTLSLMAMLCFITSQAEMEAFVSITCTVHCLGG